MADPRADHTSEQSGGESHGSDDLKAKMREALDRKQAHLHPDDSAGARAKAHGPEVVGGAPKMHRRKAGGGGS
jgi:hypothetical protein